MNVTHGALFILVVVLLAFLGWRAQKASLESFADTAEDTAFKNRLKLLGDQRDADAKATTSGTGGTSGTADDVAGSEVYSFVASYCT